MKSSMPHQREYFRPNLEAQFKYQVDCDKDKFDKIRNKQNGNWVMYPEMLSSKEYSKYIKDPFNKDTTNESLKKTLPHSKVVGTKGEHSLPPWGIPVENLTSDVGLIEKQVRCIDVRHYNAYPILPRLVYHLSTKLMNDVIHNRLLGKNEEVKVIQFITRFGYATRAKLVIEIASENDASSSEGSGESSDVLSYSDNLSALSSSDEEEQFKELAGHG
jgi:hypothetical protein